MTERWFVPIWTHILTFDIQKRLSLNFLRKDSRGFIFNMNLIALFCNNNHSLKVRVTILCSGLWELKTKSLRKMGFCCNQHNFYNVLFFSRCNITECEGVSNNSWLEHAIPKEKGKLSRCKRFQASNYTGTCSIQDFNTSVLEKCHSFVYSDEDSAVKDVS